MTTFAFVPFGDAAPENAVCCDGLVDGCKLQLSHWAGNATPKELKRDTSVEIALAAIDAGVRAELVANNHFDTDGALAVFVLLYPEIAREHRDVLVAAAEAGDFDEHTTPEGMKLEMAVRGLSGLKTERAAYARVLGELPRVVANVEKYAQWWSREWDALAAAEARADSDATFARHGAIVIEDSEAKRSGLSISWGFGSAAPIAIVAHREGVAPLPGSIVSKRTRGAKRVLWSFERAGGFEYLYELPRYAWADTVARPTLAKPSRNALARDLGEGWALKGDLGMTGLLRTTKPITMRPEEVAARLLRADTPAR